MNLNVQNHLVIRPYPSRYEALWRLPDNQLVVLRPIKREDELRWLDMFHQLSEDSIRYRFFHIIKEPPHEMRVRYCNIDYDREIAIVAEVRARISTIGALVNEYGWKKALYVTLFEICFAILIGGVAYRLL